MAAILLALAWALVIARAWAKDTAIDFAVSDATGYYAYLPSLVIDGDLRFENQLAAQFGAEIPEGFEIALQRNRWPTGVALSVAPAFIVAHGLASALHTLTGAAWCMPNGYTPIYFLACVGWAMALGTIGMICADRLLVERFSLRGRTAAAAVLTAWLGTNFVWYFVREPLVAHMIGAAWVSIAVYLVHRLEHDSAPADHPSLRRSSGGGMVTMLVFAVAMALACRLTNAFLLPVMLYAGWLILRRGMLRPMLWWLPLCVLAAAPAAVQVIIMQLISGQAAPANLQEIGYRPGERFYWTQPALLRTLFSSHHGLFFSTPALLLAAWGIWLALQRPSAQRANAPCRDPLVIALVLSAVLLWYVNASWYAWWFGHSVGNRAFVELSVLFVVGFGFAFRRLGELGPHRRWLALGLLALAIAFNYGIIVLKLVDRIEGDEMLIPAERHLFQGRWERV